jgi:hypothetical protein
MALTLAHNSTSSLTLDEYVNEVARTVDLRDEEAVVESTGLLRALANNRSVVAEKFNADLRDAMDPSKPQEMTSYASTTYLLGHGPGFVVRANLWLPPSGFGQQQESISDLNVYQLPHDHDFSFLTVGYWGSGYSTSIYEYDGRTVDGEVGEQVELRFLEHTTLPVGKVMYYRASTDIHTQEYPVEPSLSLNLLIVPDRPRPQYTFDVEAGTVSGVVSNRSEGAVGLCTLARYVGNDESGDHLDQIAATHPTPRMRWAAYESLLALRPQAETDVLTQALADESGLVQRSARRAMQALAVGADPTPDRVVLSA